MSSRKNFFVEIPLHIWHQLVILRKNQASTSSPRWRRVLIRSCREVVVIVLESLKRIFILGWITRSHETATLFDIGKAVTFLCLANYHLRIFRRRRICYATLAFALAYFTVRSKPKDNESQQQFFNSMAMNWGMVSQIEPFPLAKIH